MNIETFPAGSVSRVNICATDLHKYDGRVSTKDWAAKGIEKIRADKI